MDDTVVGSLRDGVDAQASFALLEVFEPSLLQDSASIVTRRIDNNHHARAQLGEQLLHKLKWRVLQHKERRLRGLCQYGMPVGWAGLLTRSSSGTISYGSSAMLPPILLMEYSDSVSCEHSGERLNIALGSSKSWAGTCQLSLSRW